MYGDMHVLLSQSRVGHRGHCGDRQSPPPMVSLTLQDDAMSRPKWPPPQHRPVRKRVGAEVSQVSGRGGSSRHIKDLHGIWLPTYLGVII